MIEDRCGRDAVRVEDEGVGELERQPRRDQTKARLSWTSASLLHNTSRHRHFRISATVRPGLLVRIICGEMLFSSCKIHRFSIATYSPLAYGGFCATLRSPTRLPFLLFHDDAASRNSQCHLSPCLPRVRCGCHVLGEFLAPVDHI
jgi:hypothetical protein